VDGVIVDAGEHVGEPSLRVDVVEPRGLDQRVHHGGALAAAIGAGEQPRLAAERNLEVILPMSGRISSSTIAGIHYAGEARAAFSLSGARRAISCTSSKRRAS
jgi:hypothetical protein